MSENKTVNIEYEFNAPRSLVWDAWTKPEHFSQWWSPDMFTIPVCELDVRVDGKIRIDMQGPDGVVYPSSGVFKEIVEPQRLVFTNSPLDASGNKLFEVLQTVVLSEQNGKTKLTLKAEVISATADAAPYLAGMEMGLNQAINKLDKLVSNT